MDDPSAPTVENQLRAFDAWWREAGVDCAFLEQPQSWLADESPEEAPVEPAAAPPQHPVEAPVELLAGGPEAWPRTLAEFDAWWLAEPALALGRGARVAPRGPAEAELMVLVAQPGADDSATLVSGPQGVLLGNMLKAFGIAPEACRVASLLPAHVPHPDWSALDRAGWGALTRHHLALAAPRRLLVLGQVALPLLGHDPTQGAAAFAQVALESGRVPALAALDLDALLAKPRLRASLWQRWLEWTDGNA